MAKNLTTLEEVVFYALTGSKSNPQQIAGDMGIKYNTLMRKASMTDEATGLFVHELIPFMKATGSYEVLDKLNEMAGRLYIPHPRGIRKGTDPKQDIKQYSSKFMMMISKMIRLVDAPTDELYNDIEELMKKHIGESVNLQRRAKKHLLHQTELDF